MIFTFGTAVTNTRRPWVAEATGADALEGSGLPACEAATPAASGARAWAIASREPATVVSRKARIASASAGGAGERAARIAASSGSKARATAIVALRHRLDDHPPPVGGVGDAPHVARLLEAVDHARRRAGRQRGELAEAADGHRALRGEEAEAVDVRGREAEPLGDDLGEGGTAGAHLGGCAEDRCDQLVALDFGG